MIKKFNFFEIIQDLTRSRLELVYKKVKKIKPNFQFFIKILYQMHQEIKTIIKINDFKEFFETYFIKNMKKYERKFINLNIEKIQIFYNDFKQDENPCLILFASCDNFLKNVRNTIKNK